MPLLGITLLITNCIVFLVVGHIFMMRLREAKGSLRLAKICATLTSFCAAGAFWLNVVSQLAYDPTDLVNMSVLELFVPLNLFAMLTLAFLASFAVFATYRGSGRKVMILLIFIIALLPPIYLSQTFDKAVISPAPADVPEGYLLVSPRFAMTLFAICGIPLGVIPLIAFSRMLVLARRRGDTVLSRSVLIMFSAVLLNEAAYLVFVFGSGIFRFAALVAWIPIAFFLLFAVLKITRPAETMI